MDRKTSMLLNDIPEGADYAADAGDLDLEDIPQGRMESVIGLLHTSDEKVVRFLAAKLLTSWGVFEGLKVLEGIVEKEIGTIEKIYVHRLHGYDDTFRHVGMAIIMYYANMADRGEREVARVQIYSVLSKIISLAASAPFEIVDICSFVRCEGFFEYLPLIESCVSLMIDYPEIHRWKIVDALEFLMEFDSGFVASLLRKKNKTLCDFKCTAPSEFGWAKDNEAVKGDRLGC
ncbi:hypothetical protein [Pseudomonas savastanoi]|uniref:hypothetical protein n=1 Tax=Pseudomonas savastanoi TaxID=29438 RepID=UPI001E28965C|nr:hypothetical protein [Pseudomonas savastanoi]UFI46397.1 hypothetical protein KP808_07090 [Pseudomonas savastanoi]